MDQSFRATLERFRIRFGCSQNQLAKLVGVNSSYIHRMETGESNTPSREVVASIVRSLQLESADVDKLFFAAGYLTPGFEKLGYGDTTISSVIRILGDERMTNEALADVRAVLETICARWSNNDDAPKDLPKSARLAVVVGSRTIRSVEKRASI